MPKQLRRAVVLKRLSRGRCLPLRKAASDTSPTADPMPASGGALGDYGVIIAKGACALISHCDLGGSYFQFDQ